MKHTDAFKAMMRAKMKGRKITWGDKISATKMGEKNAAWKGGPTTYRCLYCGKVFRDHEGRKARRRFCSISCGLRGGNRKRTSEEDKKRRKKAYKKLYCEKNMEKIAFDNRRRRLRERANGGTHSYGEWQLLKYYMGNICLCCYRQEPEIKLTEDHVVPVSKGGSDNLDNIQPLCNDCNMRKATKTLDYRTVFFQMR